MANTPNLSTLMKSEKKRIHMVCGRYSLRPRGKDTVALKEGGFSEINRDAIAVETEGEHRMGMYTRLYDPAVPADKEILDLMEAEIAEKPWIATHADYQIKIVGEFDSGEPWSGFDDLDHESLETYWNVMPDRQKRQYSLESMMKYELSKDEPRDEVVKVLNKLYREAQTKEKVDADKGVSL